MTHFALPTIIGTAASFIEVQYAMGQNVLWYLCVCL